MSVDHQPHNDSEPAYGSTSDASDSQNDDALDEEIREPLSSRTTPHGTQSIDVTHPELMIPTTSYPLSANTKPTEDDEPPQSVIHAPSGLHSFTAPPPRENNVSASGIDTTIHRAPGLGYDIRQPTGPGISTEKKLPSGALLPHPLTTAIEPIVDWSERATPRAQTMADFRKFDIGAHLIPGEPFKEDLPYKGTIEDEPVPDSSYGSELEVTALKAALAECWSLCNTLASLSHIHSRRSSRDTNRQEKTWESCWRLCQELYNSQDYDYASRINQTLDLCRDFCHTLFHDRDRDNELADSILRVSFELNNHLYNTHDRTLPEAFRERTLDFYITLCHRLMKQRSQRFENNSLLGACWSLAEMLFSIRQSKREKRCLDEELLGSAVQACWELCDMFREGWTRHRLVDPMATPKRIKNLRDSDSGTPQPSQAALKQNIHDVLPAKSSGPGDETLRSKRNPETPTTIFEEAATVSPDDIPIQNIFVLGQHLSYVSNSKRPSSSSSASGQTLSSEQTNSTNTITTFKAEQNLKSIKVLVLKAAMNSGFQRNGLQALSSFTKSLSSDAFGLNSWQTSLLRNYKKLVAFDPGFRHIGPPSQVTAVDIATAVQAMGHDEGHHWLQDLYRLVFGFHAEEATGREDVLLEA